MLSGGWHPLRSSEGLASSLRRCLVFGHLRSFKGWIQTEASVTPSYPVAETEKQIET